MELIERGARKLGVEILVSIVRELNLSIDYLLLDSIKPEPNAALNEIVNMLSNKDTNQLKAFLKVTRVLAKNIDDWI